MPFDAAASFLGCARLAAHALMFLSLKREPKKAEKCIIDFFQMEEKNVKVGNISHFSIKIDMVF